MIGELRAESKANTNDEERKRNRMTYNCAAITTIDNPFDPIDEFDAWYRYDCDKGYYSSQYLARLTHTSDSLSDVEYAQEVERCVDKIVEYDPLGIYRKVTKKVYVPDEPETVEVTA